MALSAKKPWLFIDKTKRVICSHESVKYLFDSGFLFEACITQASIVEALLSFSIMSEAQSLHRPLPERESIRKDLNSLTFGQLIRRCQKYSLLEQSILDNLNKYKDDRNFLTHHHLGELEDFNYSSFFERGEKLISSLFYPLREKTRKALKSMGSKDADQFE